MWVSHFFFIRDNFFELSLGVLKFLAVLSLKFSKFCVLNFFDVHKYVNCIKIPYLEQLYLKLDQHHGFLNIMPDFKGKLKEEVTFKDKLTIFLKNLNKFWGFFCKILRQIFLKMAKTESQPGHSLILFLKFWQISGSCLL